MKPQITGRWHAQGLDAPRWDSGAEVVRHLGAVQSQLHDMALWAVGRRCGRTLIELQQEFDRGAFLRTHVLRPTWHYVDATDLHWLQAVTASRVARLDIAQRRELGLHGAILKRAEVVAVDALGDGPLTRAELATALTRGGISGTDRAIAHLAMHLEIRALVVNGPMKGKQHTYRLAGPPPELPSHDDLLAQLARRYADGHGAFRARDLAWWASLTLTEARRAVELSGLEVARLDGEDHAIPADLQDAAPPAATLLSNFDEYISYARDPHDFDAFDGTVHDVMRGAGLLLVDGRLAGRWTRSVRTRDVAIDVECSPRATGRVRAAIESEAQAFATFLGRDPRLTVHT